MNHDTRLQQAKRSGELSDEKLRVAAYCRDVGARELVGYPELVCVDTSDFTRFNNMADQLCEDHFRS